MRDIFTIRDAMAMDVKDLEAKLRDNASGLEAYGMSHGDACRFLSEIMNIGIALHEKDNQSF